MFGVWFTGDPKFRWFTFNFKLEWWHSFAWTKLNKTNQKLISTNEHWQCYLERKFEYQKKKTNCSSFRNRSSGQSYNYDDIISVLCSGNATKDIQNTYTLRDEEHVRIFFSEYQIRTSSRMLQNAKNKFGWIVIFKNIQSEQNHSNQWKCLPLTDFNSQNEIVVCSLDGFDGKWWYLYNVTMKASQKMLYIIVGCSIFFFFGVRCLRLQFV